MNRKPVNIEDKRKSTSWVPAVSILEEFIPKIDQRFFTGIRKIVLLDKDYHKDKKNRAAGRYIAVEGTRFADVELYFEGYNTLPEEGKESRILMTFLILTCLIHELYHHRIRGQRILRRPKLKQEQRDADRWALKTLKAIFRKSFFKEKYRQELLLIQKIIRENIDKESNNSSQRILPRP